MHTPFFWSARTTNGVRRVILTCLEKEVPCILDILQYDRKGSDGLQTNHCPSYRLFNSDASKLNYYSL